MCLHFSGYITMNLQLLLNLNLNLEKTSESSDKNFDLLE